jgi:hypothetical protein
MSIQTMVAVLVRKADKSFDMCGTGTLLAPNEVLIHSPLSDRFANNLPDPALLSVCVATWQQPGRPTEIIAVKRIEARPDPLIGSGGTAFNVVGMVLQTASTAPPLEIDRSLAALAAHLADPFNGEAVIFTPTATPPPRSNILCATLGICC